MKQRNPRLYSASAVQTRRSSFANSPMRAGDRERAEASERTDPTEDVQRDKRWDQSGEVCEVLT